MDFGFWSLDFGFWILDFGLDEALLDIVWILHKIFPCHADSGRRILHPFTTAKNPEFPEVLGCVGIKDDITIKYLSNMNIETL